MRAMVVAALVAAVPVQGQPAATEVQAGAPAAEVVALAPAAQERVDALPRMLGGDGGYPDAFTPAFRTAVPAEQWRAIGAKLAASAGRPIGIARVEAVTPWSARVQVRFERGTMAAEIAVEPAAPNLIAGLRLTGMVAAEETVDAVIEAFRALPGRVGVTVARLGEGAPAPLRRLGEDRPFAIGSEFKLVILAELVRAVAAGERGWDDPVTLDGRPLPGGAYAKAAKGTVVPLRTLAERMISVSDNSATDVLIATLGRARIEAMVPVVGIARPDGMRPFLTTLESFKLKTLVAQGRTEWVRADGAGRRRLLAGPVAAMPIAAIPSTLFAGGPVAPDRVEWFATPDDMVRVMDWLRRHTESGPAAEARAILARNPGVGPDAAARWAYVGYKGGSEPGVMAMTCLLRVRDGGWYAVSASWNDAAKAVDDARFAALVSRLVELSAP